MMEVKSNKNEQFNKSARAIQQQEKSYEFENKSVTRLSFENLLHTSNRILPEPGLGLSIGQPLHLRRAQLG